MVRPSIRGTLKRIAIATLPVVIVGCGITAPPPDPRFSPDRFLSPSDTAAFAKLVCECNPWRCDLNPVGPFGRLVHAARNGHGISMADVRLLGSPYECQASVLGGAVAPGAHARLRAFTATVRASQ